MDHQSVGLIARGIEEAGLPTVYLGSCRDMMARVKAPRSVFLDFPLGRNCGKPFEKDLQRSILKATLKILTTSKIPGEIFELPHTWETAFTWENYQKDVQEMIEKEGLTTQEWKPKT
ncbi:MAG: hypothetical protein R6U50_04615 [Desulfobacterales bacterium]